MGIHEIATQRLPYHLNCLHIIHCVMLFTRYTIPIVILLNALIISVMTMLLDCPGHTSKIIF